MLKRLILSAFVALFLGCQQSELLKDPRTVISPPLREFTLPIPQRLKLKNGLKIFLLEDHELPLIRVIAMIRAGSIYDPPEKVGLASITAEVMRTGGTKKSSGDQIDYQLEAIGAEIELSARKEFISASLSTLREHFHEVLKIFTDILMYPRFEQDKIELAKVRERSEISRRNDRPWQIAQREFNKLIYGENHPLARTTELETIDAIQQSDLIEFHRRYFHPNNTILGVWGDFNSGRMTKILRKAFGEWKYAEINYPTLPKTSLEFNPSINYIEKEDLTQSTIIWGHKGIRRDHPDYFTLVVASHILGGGGFSSRLFQNLRSTMGLAYSVFSSHGGGWIYPGIFLMGCVTSSGSTFKVIHHLKEELKRLVSEPVNPGELRLAKESLLNSFIFLFDSKGEILKRQMRYEFYGYPADFAERFRKGVALVTTQDLLQVVKRHWHPERLTLLVVGMQKDFDKPLSLLGDVNIIPLQREKEVLIEEDPKAVDKAREILKKALKAAGGREKFQAIKDLMIISKGIYQTPKGKLSIEFTTMIILPDRIRTEAKTPVGKMVEVLNGNISWMQLGQKVMTMPASRRGRIKQSLRFGYLNLLCFLSKAPAPVQLIGQEKINGREANVLILTDTIRKGARLYIDAKTNLATKLAYDSRECLFSEYKEFSGIYIPAHLDLKTPEGTGQIKIKKIKINPGIDPKLFDKPKEGGK